MLRAKASIIALLLVAVPGGPAAAKPATAAASAAALRAEGRRCYRQRDYRCALDRFERALSLAPTPEMRFNVASAQDKLGLTALAVRQYRIYLREAGTGTPPLALRHIQRRLALLLRRVGLLSLELEPPAARLLINETRFALDDARTGEGRYEIVLDPGAYRLRLEAAGYLPAEQTWTLAAGDRRTVEIALLRAPPPTRGALRLQSQPAGARILVDGQLRDAVTPARIEGLAAGTHSVRLATRDRAYACTVRIVAGEEQRISAALQPVVARLSVQSEPAGAEVALDGRSVGRTPLTVAAVAAGEHVVRVLRAGYAPFASRIEVTGWSAPLVALRARLSPQSAPLAGASRPVLPLPFPRFPVGVAIGRRDAAVSFAIADEGGAAYSLNVSGQWALLRWLQLGFGFSALDHGYIATVEGPDEITDLGELRLHLSGGWLEGRGAVPALAAHVEAVLPTHTDDRVARDVGLHSGATATWHVGRFTGSVTGGIRWATRDGKNPLGGFLDLYGGARILRWLAAQLALQVTGYLEPKMDEPAVVFAPGLQAELWRGLQAGFGVRLAGTDVGRLLYTRSARAEFLLHAGYRLW